MNYCGNWELIVGVIPRRIVRKSDELLTSFHAITRSSSPLDTSLLSVNTRALSINISKKDLKAKRNFIEPCILALHAKANSHMGAKEVVYCEVRPSLTGDYNVSSLQICQY